MAASPALKTAALWSGRLLLGGAFAYAAAQKILDPAAFATDLGHFRLLPVALIAPFALYLPWLELLCGVGVLCRWSERGALFLTALLCGVFCVALASAWFRGLDINCGCFGHGPVPSSLPLAIARSFALGLIALLLLRQSQRAGKAVGFGT